MLLPLPAYPDENVGNWAPLRVIVRHIESHSGHQLTPPLGRFE